MQPISPEKLEGPILEPNLANLINSGIEPLEATTLRRELAILLN